MEFTTTTAAAATGATAAALGGAAAGATAGGDGTAHKLLDHIDDITMPLAMLPAGTSNNIARSLGFPENPEAFAGALRNTVTRSLEEVGID